VSNIGYSVPALSWAKIDDLADNLRAKYDLAGKQYFPIVEVLELVMSNKFRMFDIEIVSREDMPEEYATTSQTGRLMRIREDTYRKACSGNGRARFTLAHELGHIIMHCCGVEVFALASGEHVEPYRHSEKQANYFAASILMPKRFFTANDTVELIVRRHGVSREAALNRLKYLFAKGYLRPPNTPRLF